MKSEFDPDALRARFPNLIGSVKEEAHEEIERRERETRKRCEAAWARQRHADAAAFLRACGKRYEHCRLDSFIVTCDAQRQAVVRLREFLDNVVAETEAGNGVVLFGPSGSGKDHLLVAIAYETILRHGGGKRENVYRDDNRDQGGFSILWKNGVELFAEMRRAIDGDENEDSVLRPLIQADILVLSDPLPPDAELTRYQRETLYRVLESRYCNCRPTWVSVNVSNKTEAAQRLGAPCHDRLRDGALLIHCCWPSYRNAKP